MADLKDKNTESIQETKEIINRAQKVVNGVQIQELNGVMDLLTEDIFDDSQERFYIVIDDLDTGWVHDSLRFKLIRALIETIKKFRRISNLKIVISLRSDLLETVLKNTTSAGFQQEKYADMYLRLRWDDDQLKTLATRRISFLFKQQYINQNVNFYDIFARRVGEADSFEYILERTLRRPRDVIAFINECLSEASGQASINHRAIRRAEDAYSRNRLDSLCDEWREAYGDLEDVIDILSRLGARFTSSDLSDSLIEDLCISLLNGDDAEGYGIFKKQCDLVVANQSNWGDLRKNLIQTLYSIGAIGFKSRDGAPYEWSFQSRPTLQFNKVNEDSTFAIHPMLFKALGKYTDPRRLT